MHSPCILNVAYTGMGLEDDPTFISGAYFWALRANTLEAQAVEPIKNGVEARGVNIAEEDIFPVIIERPSAIPE